MGESRHQGAKEGELAAQWRNKREGDSGGAVDGGSRWKDSQSFVTILFFLLHINSCLYLFHGFCLPVVAAG